MPRLLPVDDACLGDRAAGTHSTFPKELVIFATIHHQFHACNSNVAPPNSNLAHSCQAAPASLSSLLPTESKDPYYRHYALSNATFSSSPGSLNRSSKLGRKTNVQHCKWGMALPSKPMRSRDPRFLAPRQQHSILRQKSRLGAFGGSCLSTYPPCCPSRSS